MMRCQRFQNLSVTAINGTGNIVATTGATSVAMSGAFTGSFSGSQDSQTPLVGAASARSYPTVARIDRALP